MSRKTTSLSAHELAVMNTFWEAERPLSKSEVIELSPNRSWKDSTIHLLLNSLLDKGYIKVDGMVKATKHYARTFSPTMTANEFLVNQITQSGLLNKQTGASFSGVISGLIENADNKDELIVELVKLIDEKSRQ